LLELYHAFRTGEFTFVPLMMFQGFYVADDLDQQRENADEASKDAEEGEE
jgi:hypothetical protein